MLQVKRVDMKRQIVLDTETTGLDPKAGHRIIEVGCIEMINRTLTGNNRHFYINPNRKVDDEAVAVHGITNEFLYNKPLFYQIVSELMDYLKGAELIIHNAAFDVSFINHELSLLTPNRYGQIQEYCSIVDTLALARKMHPGQRNSLDALCKRYSVNNAHRELHGGLLDAGILADVYLAMTGGQISLLLEPDAPTQEAKQEAKSTQALNRKGLVLPVIHANDEELALHVAYMAKLRK